MTPRGKVSPIFNLNANWIFECKSLFLNSTDCSIFGFEVTFQVLKFSIFAHLKPPQSWKNGSRKVTIDHSLRLIFLDSLFKMKASTTLFRLPQARPPHPLGPPSAPSSWAWRWPHGIGQPGERRTSGPEERDNKEWWSHLVWCWQSSNPRELLCSTAELSYCTEWSSGILVYSENQKISS